MGVKTLTVLILEKLAEAGELTVDAFLPKKYPEARLWREFLGLDDYYEFSPRTFSTILWRLKKQNLVVRRGTNRSSFWRITKKGEDRLRRRTILPLSDGTPRLVIFDIPEMERKKRGVIRQELTNCEYQPLQKSVWIGYRPLPEDFIELLDTLRLKKFVHIVSIKSGGTLG